MGWSEGDAKQGLKVVIAPPPIPVSNGLNGGRIGISEDEFFEVLGKKDPAMPDVLRAFLTKAKTLGVYSNFQGGLNLKHAAAAGQQPLNMGTVTKGGILNTAPSTWWAPLTTARTYNEALADAIGGQIKASKDPKEAGIRTATGKMPRLWDLLPQHEQLWLDAIARYISQTSDQSGPGTAGAGNGEPAAPGMQSEEELRNLAHERVWGQSGQQFEKLQSVLPHQPARDDGPKRP